jgi:hypothetical protein
MSTSIQEQDLIQTIKQLEQRISDLERQQRAIGSNTGTTVTGPNSVIGISDIVGTPNARGIEIYKDKISLQGSNGAGDIQGPPMDITWDSWSLQINFPSVRLYRGFTEPIVVSTSIPATPTSVGSPGEIASNNTHLYICTNDNTWRRVAIGTW